MNMYLAVEDGLVIRPAWDEVLWGVGGILLLLGLAFIAWRDMNKRGQLGVAWGLLVLFAPVVGVLIWLALRDNWSVRERRSSAG